MSEPGWETLGLLQQSWPELGAGKGGAAFWGGGGVRRQSDMTAGKEPTIESFPSYRPKTKHFYDTILKNMTSKDIWTFLKIKKIS